MNSDKHPGSITLDVAIPWASFDTAAASPLPGASAWLATNTSGASGGPPFRRRNAPLASSRVIAAGAIPFMLALAAAIALIAAFPPIALWLPRALGY